MTSFQIIQFVSMGCYQVISLKTLDDLKLNKLVEIWSCFYKLSTAYQRTMLSNITPHLRNAARPEELMHFEELKSVQQCSEASIEIHHKVHHNNVLRRLSRGSGPLMYRRFLCFLWWTFFHFLFLLLGWWWTSIFQTIIDPLYSICSVNKPFFYLKKNVYIYSKI